MQKFLKFFALLALLLSSCVRCTAQMTAESASGKTIAERLGYEANSRLLLIHADDFGMSHSINRATMEALEKNWVGSASVMTPCPWFQEAAVWAQTHPEADLGLDLTLNSEWSPYRWGPVSTQKKDSSLFDADGYLPLTTQNVIVGAKAADLEVEGQAQIEKAQHFGIHLSHIDAHMSTMTSSAEMSKIYIGLGEKYKIPLLLQKRDISVWNKLQISKNTKRYGTQLPSHSIVLDAILQIMPGVPKSDWLEAYKKLLNQLPPGTYELVVHLGYDDDEMRGMAQGHPNWGAEWRQNDFDLVRNPEFQRFLKDQKFILISWKELARAVPEKTNDSSQTPVGFSK
jgi:predicted glycoside hydrolase/deacetylase ChbG (UPF0249 family)